MTLSLRLFFASLALFFGCRNGDISNLKIVGGRPTVEAYPWFVQIVDGANAAQGYCGGTLIAPRIVITAAHCVEPQYVSTMYVAMGMADGDNLHLNHPIKVEGVMVHPDYSPSGDDPGQNDIALLYLADYNDVTFERPVAPLRIHRGQERVESLASSARVLGLGNTSSLGWLFDGVIREVDLPLLDMKRCSEKYEDIGASQLCAGNFGRGGVDSCQGDSGGPLMVRGRDGDWILAGLVSFGEGCAQKKAPGVYTRLSSFSEWIDKSIETLSRPWPAKLEAPEISRLLQTHCLSLFGNLPVSQSVGMLNNRETIYEMGWESFAVYPAETMPSGEQMGTCTPDLLGHKVVARWLRVAKTAASDEVKVVVAIEADGQLWLSSPQTLNYQQDRLTCQTSAGNVVLVNQHRYTTVQFKDVFYDLGEPVEEPDNGQSTWGCAVVDASIEVFERPVGETQRLAARIHHSQLGTVTLALNRSDKEPQVGTSIEWGNAGRGFLKINNVSDTDIFTWRLTCPVSFSLVLRDGRELKSEALGTGGSFAVTLDKALVNEGSILSGKKLEIELRRLDGQRGAPEGCTINDTFEVEVSPAK